jgi:hypothetical protein
MPARQPGPPVLATWCTCAVALAPTPTMPRPIAKGWPGVQPNYERPRWQLRPNRAATPAAGAARPVNYGKIRRGQLLPSQPFPDQYAPTPASCPPVQSCTFSAPKPLHSSTFGPPAPAPGVGGASPELAPASDRRVQPNAHSCIIQPQNSRQLLLASNPTKPDISGRKTGQNRTFCPYIVARLNTAQRSSSV